MTKVIVSLTLKEAWNLWRMAGNSIEDLEDVLGTKTGGTGHDEAAAVRAYTKLRSAIRKAETTKTTR